MLRGRPLVHRERWPAGSLPAGRTLRWRPSRTPAGGEGNDVFVSKAGKGATSSEDGRTAAQALLGVTCVWQGERRERAWPGAAAGYRAAHLLARPPARLQALVGS